MPDTPATPIPSCTVLLLRDAPGGMQVLMVQRSHRVDFAEGAMVFPGGRVDPGDADPAWRARVRGADSLDDAALKLRVAGVRETFEESGVLLGYVRGEPGLLGPERLEMLQPLRAPVAHGELPFLELIEREALELDLGRMVPWARWITPDMLPRRFDTHFFATTAPPGQLAVHDGQELVATAWLTPRGGLEDAAAGRRKMVFATLMNLERLASCADVEQALAAARARPVVTVQPRVVEDADGGSWLHIPADAGYPRTRVSAAGLASP